MLGLEFIDLMSLRRALTFQPVLDSSSSWAALGEAFLKFFYAAYFFSRYQNDTEGALTTRIDNESRNNVICTYLESSGLAVNACYHKAGHVEDTAATIFRRVIGAAISLDGADAALRTIITLGMKTDFPVYTIKDIEAVYRQYHPVNNRPSAQVLETLDDNILARIQTVQEALGYEFRDPQLLVEAITHRSATVSTMEIESYERLEFLGDAVVEFCIAEHYYR
ncbi:Dicer-like protein 2, partial [Haplosporangium sp. Z 27]